MERYDLICLGCGPAGEKAATQAAYFKRRVAVVERNPRPGGAMVNTGTIPSKALRETALTCSAFRRRPIPGVSFEPDRGLSVARFMARRHLVEQQEHDRIERSFDWHKIDVVSGEGRLVGPHHVEVTGPDGSVRRLESEFILIATGSSPLRPSHIPFDHPNVVDADGILEFDRLPSSLLIVGGGVIGSEYASVFAEINVPVTLVQTQPHILPFVDDECREHLERAMRDRGVQILGNRSVRAVETQDDGSIRLVFDEGEPVTGEVLLWAAGRSSNTAGIGLEEVGVECGDRGLVVVNEHFQTNVPSIYAAGDVIGFPALASTSMEQGRVAACHMFAIEFKKRLAELMPLGLYTIPSISMVGLTAEQAEEAGHEVVVGRALYRDNARGRMLGDEEGLLKCVFDRPSRALLGTMIVGQDATELIHLAQCVIANGEGIDYFIGNCFNYPSLAELYKYAAYNALQAMASTSAGAPRRAATAA